MPPNQNSQLHMKWNCHEMKSNEKFFHRFPSWKENKYVFALFRTETYTVWWDNYENYCCIVQADYEKSLVKIVAILDWLEMESTSVGSHCILWLKLFPICMIPGVSKLWENMTLDAFSCILATWTYNYIFTCSFVLLLLKCYLECLTIMFDTLNYLHFAWNRRFFMISTRFNRTDRRADGRTNGRTDGRADRLTDGLKDGHTLL